MAGELYRGTAWWRALMGDLMSEYLQGLGTGVAGISESLWEQQLPMFEKMMSDYYGGAAGLGQIVPGVGGGTASQMGMERLMGDYMAGITQTALGAYQMPWQAIFGGAPTGTARSALEAEKMRQQSGAWSEGIGAGFGMGGMLGGSGGCCFIFIEADNGILDRIARRYRDEHGTEKQKVGYKRLANWLVPLMREYKIVKELVKWTMVKPMIAWGKAFYGENRYGHIFYPVAKGWLKAFEIYGRS